MFQLYLWPALAILQAQRPPRGKLADRRHRSVVAAWARYQEGISRREMGQEDQARHAFSRVSREYGELHVARLAQEALTTHPSEKVTPAVSRDPHCGPKALARACEALGVKVSVEELVRRCKPGPEGCTFEQLAIAARELGLKAEAIHVNRAALLREKPPAIAWVNRNHYMALLAIGDPLIVFDPNNPTDRQVGVKEFSGSWDGFLLVLSRTGKKDLNIGASAGKAAQAVPVEKGSGR